MKYFMVCVYVCFLLSKSMLLELSKMFRPSINALLLEDLTCLQRYFLESKQHSSKDGQSFKLISASADARIRDAQ